MKNIVKNFRVVCVCAILVFFSCTDDKDPVLSDSPTAPAFTAPAGGTAYVLTDSTTTQVVDNFTFTAANYGFLGEVTYTLQMAAVGDNFASAINIVSGESTKLSPTQEAINAGACPLGLTYDTTNNVEFRVKAVLKDLDMDLDLDASANKILYSDVLTLSINPYPPAAPVDSWGIIGSAISPYDWSVDIDMTWDPCNSVWTITLDVIDGEFKFRANDDWGTNYGDTGANGSLDDGGDNIAITAGNYTIVLNITAGTYTVTKN